MSEFNEEEWFKNHLADIFKCVNNRFPFKICTGCEGIENPYSKIFDCDIGMGCEECNQTGIVLWDIEDYPWFQKSQSLKAENKKLRGCVEFYAEKERWLSGHYICDTKEDGSNCYVVFKGIQIASQTLEETDNDTD